MRARPGALLLMPAAALVVHQARYSLTYGSRANAELAAQGHSYLHSLVPWAVLALGIGASMFIRRVAQAARTGDSGTFTRISATGLWAITTVALVAIYVTQETLEALGVTGHPDGVSGVLGHGGWWAFPAAAAAALGVVLLLRLGRAVLRLVAGSADRGAHARTAGSRLPGSIILVALPPLALAHAGRAPPRLPT